MSSRSGDQGDDFGLESDDGSETDLEMGQTEDEQKNSEAVLFLQTLKSDSTGTIYEEPVPQGPSRKSRTGRLMGLVSSGVFPWLVNFILVVALLSGSHHSQPYEDAPPVLTTTIAKDYIEYRAEVMYDGVDKRNPMSEYQGWPSKEKDALWDRFNGAMFRIPHQEAEQLPHMTIQVALPESLAQDEYLVGVTFTHALHCLNQLRKVTYPRHYNSSLVDEDGRVNYFKWWHTDHCVEVLRKYITCHADTTPYTFDWVEGARISVHPGTVHTCRNFDRIMDVSSASLTVPFKYLPPPSPGPLFFPNKEGKDWCVWVSNDNGY